MVFTHRVQSEPVGCYQHPAGSPVVVGGAGIEPATFSVSGRRAPAAPTALELGIPLRSTGSGPLLRPGPVSEPVPRYSIFNEARFHCANRPRGGGGNRTRVQGFAGPCLSHSATPPAPTFPGGIMALDIRSTVRACGQRDGIRRLRADDGIRTRDPHLGKVMLYQLSHVRMWCTPNRAYPPGQVCVQNCSRSWPPSKLGPVACRQAMRADRYSARRALATLRRAARWPGHIPGSPRWPGAAPPA